MCCVCTEPTVRYVTEMRKGQCRHNHTHIMEQHNLYTVELVAPRQPPACRVHRYRTYGNRIGNGRGIYTFLCDDPCCAAIHKRRHYALYMSALLRVRLETLIVSWLL